MITNLGTVIEITSIVLFFNKSRKSRRMISIHASYSGGLRFKSQPIYRLFVTEAFRV